MLHGAEFNENDNFKSEKLIMHGYKIVHGADLNKNGNCNYRKLLMHGWIVLIAVDIHGNEKLRKETLSIWSFGIEGLTYFATFFTQNILPFGVEGNVI